jgi:hypothetical protein
MASFRRRRASKPETAAVMILAGAGFVLAVVNGWMGSRTSSCTQEALVTASKSAPGPVV